MSEEGYKSKSGVLNGIKSVSVVSTVGAGDSFGATFLSFYNKTKNAPYALKLSAKISAFVVTHKQAVPKNAKNFIKQILSD